MNTSRFSVSFDWLFKRVTARKLGFLFLLIGLIGAIPGPIPYLPITWLRWLWVFHQNISPELVGIGLTVLIIDWANERREDAKLREQLLREMGARDNGVTQRALTEIKTRKWLYDGTMIGRNFRKASLDEAQLVNACLENVNFSEASLTDANFILSKLNGANFWAATLVRADMREVDATSAKLTEAEMTDAKLDRAKLTEANLASAILNETSLTDAELSRAVLRRASLRNARLIRSILVEADMREADLEGAVLAGADLTNADLTGAILKDANFGEVLLTIVGAEKLNLPPVIRIKSTRTITTLEKSEQSPVYTKVTNFSGADLQGANLQGANVTLAQLSKARSLHNTLMPDGSMFEEWIAYQEPETLQLFNLNTAVQLIDPIKDNNSREVLTVREALNYVEYSASYLRMLCRNGVVDAKKDDHTGEWLVTKTSLFQYARFHKKLITRADL